ncbi:MAG: sigma-54 dependent transcriptional regulator [Bacteroidota bacterium]|nr:sigma-54 dependent transcriptional regulator [Candidatus Kapabacteria bacterium]MCS7302724.1 sigma-54 dependent transcriptional regulator [Candidatus Kapabacteria bacterium]MCX7937059.1 sigma-54 dependent transcriptional regulator [Chlorobiota bacterium]MDW8075158.1 sigma-54 dependent transcriptional regulator [Bacteroidota bacterium]MDW8272389.1 sigma-54 dependent transcriptional regulator [Bacteroidota bacterium]
MERLRNTILVIDDDRLVGESIVHALSVRYERVVHVPDPQQALEEFETIAPDVVLLDIYLGRANGIDLLEHLRREGVRVPVIVMTGFGDIKTAVRAMKAGADEFIAKPIDLEQLEVVVERVLQHDAMRRQVSMLEEELARYTTSNIIGSSEALRKALQIATIVAKSPDTTALILGESGTGKEVIARFIHQQSARAKGPFITVNCGAIPRELAESELFGYERGAFTGATDKVRQGRFEQAHRGTILLDEIGELSPEMQVKLLRVLQERKFYRLGGSKEISVDVRVIAATNRDLEKLVEEGKFREDLYYRLNVATIYLPPLRERKEDIPLLAAAFIKEFNAKFGKAIEGFEPQAAELLQQYHWKGNVRELRNVIERAVLLSTGPVITREQLSFLRMDWTPPTKGVSVRSTLAPGEYQLVISDNGAPLDTVVRELIAQTLALAGGNHTAAARMLAISEKQLAELLRRYGLEEAPLEKKKNVSAKQKAEKLPSNKVSAKR